MVVVIGVGDRAAGIAQLHLELGAEQSARSRYGKKESGSAKKKMKRISREGFTKNGFRPCDSPGNHQPPQ